ncbi:MAG: adenylate/guanylate cyclase domain-containing protein, partial [bacterium]|nr:adenylate/guanylate cyclase domain-containing protein [bacterium]
KYLPEGIFDDALVFVGFALYSEVSAENKPPDHYAVPFSRFYGGYMPGVEIHAHAAASLIQGIGLRYLAIPRWIYPLLTCISVMVFIYFRSFTGVLLYANFFAAITFASAYMFQHQGTYISPAMIIASVSIGYFVSPFVHYFVSQRQRKFLKNAFSSYLSPALVAELVKNPEKLELGGKEADVTVLFLDISGFTSLSEKVSASELISLMNRVLGGFAEVIIGNNGYIDKFIGDAIMAVWGVPVPCNHPQEFAVGTAVEIIEKLNELNEQIVAENGVPLAVRVGIASGRVVAGNVGGAGRLNYTVLGNSVNLSSRLEGANKQYRSSILMDSATAASLDESFKYYHQLTAIDRIRVKGQETTVVVYTMADIGAHAKKLFERGLSFYEERAWKAAHKLFNDVLKIEPSFYVALELARRCEYYFDHPPHDDWDGVYTMTEK